MWPRLVFIGGAPRSGTSLVQKILGLHSQVFGGPEFDHLPQIGQLYIQLKRGLENGRQIEFYTPDIALASVRQLVFHLVCGKAAQQRKSVVTEKTPDNIYSFTTLAEIFPEAQFIFVVRDPREIIHSMRQVADRAKRKGRTVEVGNDLAADLRRIESAMDAGCDFATHHPSRCQVISYTRLVEAPDPTVTKLCDFLCLGFERGMLCTEQRNASSETLIPKDGVWYTTDMYDRPIDQTSLATWKTGLNAATSIAIEDFFARRAYWPHYDFRLQKASLTTRLRHLLTFAQSRQLMPGGVSVAFFLHNLFHRPRRDLSTQSPP